MGTDNAGVGGVGGALPPPDAGGAALPAPTPADAAQHLAAPNAPSAPAGGAEHAPQSLQPPNADAVHAHPTAEHAASGPSHAPPHGPQTQHAPDASQNLQSPQADASHAASGNQPAHGPQTQHTPDASQNLQSAQADASHTASGNQPGHGPQTQHSPGQGDAMQNAHAHDASHGGGQHGHDSLQAPRQKVGSKERGARRLLRGRPRLFVAAGSAVAVVTAGVVVVATRDDSARAACTAERSSTALTDPDWPLPTTGNIVNDQSCSIAGLSGYWDGDWGQIVLRIDDDGTAVGAYEHDAGLIVGTVTDGVLRGKWCESPSYAGASDAGLVEMRAIEIDGVTTIDGRWIYGSDPSSGWNDNWDVTGKTGETPPDDLTTRLDTAEATCIGPS